MTKEELEAITQGVYDAWLTVLTTAMGYGTGDYPISRQEIHDAIAEGVRQAFVDVMSATKEACDD
jgi:hypothetical protein